MSKLINLRTVKKQRKRAGDRSAAAARAAGACESAAARARREAEGALEARRLDAHRRDGASEPE